MNTKQVIALSVLALSAVSASSAFAGGEADYGVNYSSIGSESRATVKAETQQAARSGQLEAAGERDFGVYNTPSVLSRAEVKQEFYEARANGQLEGNGEVLAQVRPVQRFHGQQANSVASSK